jgi:hypothetical protein
MIDVNINWVTEDAEIESGTPGDLVRQDPPGLRKLLSP